MRAERRVYRTNVSHTLVSMPSASGHVRATLTQVRVLERQPKRPSRAATTLLVMKDRTISGWISRITRWTPFVRTASSCCAGARHGEYESRSALGSRIDADIGASRARARPDAGTRVGPAGRAGFDMGRSAARSRATPRPCGPDPRGPARRAAGPATGNTARQPRHWRVAVRRTGNGARALPAARRWSRGRSWRGAPAGHHPQERQAGARPGQRCDRPGVADRIRDCLATTTRATGARASRDDRRHARLHGSRTDRDA